MAENKNESTTLVNFRVDQVVKDSAEAVLAGMGMSTSSYIGMCLRKLAQDREVPFNFAIDSEFWMRESDVSEVMKYVEDGTLLDAIELEQELSDDLSKKWADTIQADGVEDVSGWAFLMTMINGVSIDDMCDDLDLFIERGVPVTATSMRFEKPESFIKFCEDMRATVDKKCSGFCDEHGVDLDGRDPSYAVAGIVNRAVYAYENSKDNLATRFFTSKADTRVYKTVAALSEIREGRDREIAEGKMEEQRDKYLTQSAMHQSLVSEGVEEK